MIYDLNSLETLITPGRLANLLGVQIDTLAAWRRRGFGPPWLRLGRRAIRYPESQLHEWLQFQAAPVASTKRPQATALECQK